MKSRLISCWVFLFLLGVTTKGQAAPFLINSSPVYEADRGELVLFVGGVSDDGSTLKPSGVEVTMDGEKMDGVYVKESFAEHAQVASEQSAAWKSPLSVGLVYLWVKEVPAAISDGLLQGMEGFFKRIPARSNTYTTLYGRKRQPIPILKASEVAGQLHDLGFLEGTRPNLADAIRVNLKSLGMDESPLKLLLILTDGRDFADPAGESSADFAAIAQEIQKANAKPLLLIIPPPAADRKQSSENLTGLVSLGAFYRYVEQPVEVQTTLEALGQAIADLRQVRIPIPWQWRTMGGQKKIRLNLKVDEKARSVDLGKLSIPAQISQKILFIGILGVLGVVAFIVVGLMWRRKEALPTQIKKEPVYDLLEATHGYIRRGFPAQRILIALTREFPKEVSNLAKLDASVFSDPRYPIFKTQAGKRRVEELLTLLQQKKGDDSLLDPELADILVSAIEKRITVDQAADSISAKVPEAKQGAFSRMNLEELSNTLRASAERFPVLSTLRARGVALEIQELLQSEAKQANPIAVAWLVRSAGPGKRGETLRLKAESSILGKHPESTICVREDSAISDRHAEFREKRGDFFILPIEGLVMVEDKMVTNRHPLGDGDTITMGESRFVFKCVSTGHKTRSRSNTF